MRALALLFAIAVVAPVAVAAEQPTGVSGYIINADTNRPISGAEVSIYRMPVENTTRSVGSIRTNKRGYFSDIVLSPGRYIIMASGLDARAGCEISDLYSGAVSRVRIEISSKGEHCSGSNVRNAIVQPGQTASVYIVH